MQKYSSANVWTKANLRKGRRKNKEWFQWWYMYVIDQGGYERNKRGFGRGWGPIRWEKNLRGVRITRASPLQGSLATRICIMKALLKLVGLTYNYHHLVIKGKLSRKDKTAIYSSPQLTVGIYEQDWFGIKPPTFNGGAHVKTQHHWP